MARDAERLSQLDGPITWRTYTGERASVHAPQDSYAARRAPTELREAERAIAELEALLEVPAERRGHPVEIYLVDAVVGTSPGQPDLQPAALAGLHTGADVIVRAVQPDAPGEPLVLPLTSLLLARWFG